jgi:anti-anti-sigma regulatory factor
MKTSADGVDRVSCAMNLDLNNGQHGASARIEIFERDATGAGAASRLALHGWIDRAALRRLEETLGELVARGAVRITLDCSRVRHIEFAALPELRGMLARHWPAPGTVVVAGLSPHLRDLFRAAGWSGEWGPAGAAGFAAARFALTGLQREWAT